MTQLPRVSRLIAQLDMDSNDAMLDSSDEEFEDSDNDDADDGR